MFLFIVLGVRNCMLGCESFGHFLICDNIFYQVWDQDFDQIFGQGFDQGYWEGKKTINTEYSTTRPRGKILKATKTV